MNWFWNLLPWMFLDRKCFPLFPWADPWSWLKERMKNQLLHLPRLFSFELMLWQNTHALQMKRITKVPSMLALRV